MNRWSRSSCAALNESLLGELFVRERRCGADKRREGTLCRSDGGTLFLDEIGDISPLMRKHVCCGRFRARSAARGEVTRRYLLMFGYCRYPPRRRKVSAGRFRRDLYYHRLRNVVAIEIRFCAKRREDIPLLARPFSTAAFAEQRQSGVKGFTPQAMDLRNHYDWPGNIRELESAIERAVLRYCC